MSRHVVITAAVRTPIGTFGGALSGHTPTQLGALCVAEALRRAELEGDRVEHVVFGNVVLTESRDAYLARTVATDVAERFGASVGHFHTRPVGPHPRGSVQLTVAPDRFGEVACWLPLHRRGLTVFAHPSTGDDRSDHTKHVIWFGPSEPLATAMFD